MLRHRVIPVVLLDGYSVVKTIKFDVRRNLGNPITVARIYNTRNVDELILLDIDASKEGRKIDLVTIEDIARECFMPLCVGGGLGSVEDIAGALAKGADKVALNTEAHKTPSLVREASRTFGAQCIVVSVDVKKNDDIGYQVYLHGGLEFSKPLVEWLPEIEALGAGEILLNSVDLDGTMTGYDQELIKMASGLVEIPVIAAGGASTPEDCARAIRSGASAVGVSSIFHFTNHTPDDIKAGLHEAGLPVRKIERHQ